MTAQQVQKLIAEGVITEIVSGETGTRIKVKADNLKFPETYSFYGELAPLVNGYVNGMRVRVHYKLSSKLGSTGKPYKDGLGIENLSGAPVQTAPIASVEAATPGKATVTEQIKDLFPPSKAAPVDATRASIEAQVCMIQARELLQMLVAMRAGTDAENMAFIKANWPVLAHIAKATLEEAR